ncbi:uncharacterized protein LOC131063724 isoform X2 [Cryptomeria japonica]|nr:uncharacterized protein LOC131063724 isoform X2 [Cryptomeria japonica]
MDILYRVGETHQGIPTYTPRLLAMDSRGSLGAVRASGSLYEETSLSDASSVTTWGGSVARYISELNEKNKFLQSLEEEDGGNHHDSIKAGNSSSEIGTEDRTRIQCLENGVQYWTDYCKVQFHPLSLYELQGLWKDITPFDNFGNGREILTGHSQADELSDRLRFFVEECDHIQGFQFLVDDSGGFASIAADFVESIADEYAHTPILMHTARDPSSYTSFRDMRSSMTRALHDAISFVKLSSFSSLTVPVGLSSLAKSQASRFLCINDSKLFHSSAVYASAFHTATLPFRMGVSGPSSITEVDLGSLDMDTMIRNLSHQSKQHVVACLDAAIPAPSVAGIPNRSVLERSLHSLTPDVVDNSPDMEGVETLVIQGALRSGRGGQAFLSEVRDSLVGVQKDCPRGVPICHLSVSRCPLPIPLPFPCIFGNFIGQNGEILSSPFAGTQGRGGLDVLSIPIATRLRSSKAILPYLEKRLQNLRNWGIARGSPGGQLLEGWGLQKADVEDLGESLSEMVLSFDGTLMETSSESD